MLLFRKDALSREENPLERGIIRQGAYTRGCLLQKKGPLERGLAMNRGSPYYRQSAH